MNSAELKAAIANREMKVRELSKGVGAANNREAIACHLAAIAELKGML